jgi:GNAT superfamily N-acetyltransferase
MLNTLRMRLAQVSQAVKSNGWRFFFREVLFLNRTAIVVEKDLSEVRECSAQLTHAKLKLVEIDKDMLSSGRYHFVDTSRFLKALNYVRHGYGGYALVRANVVIGDTWHCASESTDDPRALHEDLRRFGFKTWVKNHVYTFDVFVVPAERKGGISAAFQNDAMLALRSKGYTKAYGFYWADNIPARWCTRVTNKWKEVREFNVSRFLVFKRAVPIRKEEPAPKEQPALLMKIPVGEKKEI